MKDKFEQWVNSHIKEEPFCPFLPAYCDTPDYSTCESCELLIKLYGDALNDCLSNSCS